MKKSRLAKDEKFFNKLYGYIKKFTLVDDVSATKWLYKPFVHRFS